MRVANANSEQHTLLHIAAYIIGSLAWWRVGVPHSRDGLHADLHLRGGLENPLPAHEVPQQAPEFARHPRRSRGPDGLAPRHASEGDAAVEAGEAGPGPPHDEDVEGDGQLVAHPEKCIVANVTTLFWSLILLTLIQCIAAMVLNQLAQAWLVSDGPPAKAKFEVYLYYGIGPSHARKLQGKVEVSLR